MEIDILSIILLLAFTFIAAFTQRLTGFGFGILIMIFLPYFLPSYGEATAVSGLLSLCTTTITASGSLKHFKFKNFWPLMLGYIITSFIAIKLLTMMDGGLLRKILGVVLILVAIWMFFFNDKVRLKANVPAGIGLGGLSGLMGGFCAIQGPPAVVYFLSKTDNKNEYISLMAFFIMTSNIIATAFRAVNGIVTPVVFKIWLIALPLALAGLFVGRLVFNKLHIEVIRKIIYIFIAISGVIALVL